MASKSVTRFYNDSRTYDFAEAHYKRPIRKRQHKRLRHQDVCLVGQNRKEVKIYEDEG